MVLTIEGTSEMSDKKVLYIRLIFVCGVLAILIIPFIFHYYLLLIVLCWDLGIMFLLRRRIKNK